MNLDDLNNQQSEVKSEIIICENLIKSLTNTLENEHYHLSFKDFFIFMNDNKYSFAYKNEGKIVDWDGRGSASHEVFNKTYLTIGNSNKIYCLIDSNDLVEINKFIQLLYNQKVDELLNVKTELYIRSELNLNKTKLDLLNNKLNDLNNSIQLLSESKGLIKLDKLIDKVIKNNIEFINDSYGVCCNFTDLETDEYYYYLTDQKTYDNLIEFVYNFTKINVKTFNNLKVI